jgi:hypothetical protein
MFLSNQQAAALVILSIVCVAAGCSWFVGSEVPANSNAAVSPPGSGIPFETKEPETFQAYFITIAGGTETRSHFAKKAGRWRLDSFDADGPTRSIIQGQTLAYIDHTRKQYSEPPTNGPDAQPAFLQDLTTSLLHPKQPAIFEKLGADGSLERYRVTTEGSNTASTIIYDTTIKMIVRNEFDGGFAFEMRNFTLEVSDEVFQVPSGYRNVAWAAYKQQ